MKCDLDLTALYEELILLAASGSIQQVMNTVFKATDVPIMAVDVAYNVLGIAPANQKTGEYTWDYLLENRGFDIEHTVMEYEAGTMQSVDGRKAPYVIDWGKNAPLPKILGLILIDGQVEGYVTMQCKPDEVCDTLLRLMDMVQQVCSILYRRHARETDSVRLHMKTFVLNLLQHRFRTQKDIELWRSTTDFYPKGPYRVYAIGAGHQDPLNVLSCIKRNVRTHYPSCLAVTYEGTLYVLRYCCSTAETSAAMRENSLPLLHSFGAHCGVSECFTDLLEFEAYQYQAEAAMRFAKQSSQSFCLFSENYLPSLLDMRLSELPAAAYTLPAVQRLIDFDAEHHTDLVPTLECFVRHCFSTTAAAAELHLHRNTMLYRIEKIEEVLGLRLQSDQIFPLIVCMYIRKLLEKQDAPAEK